MTENKLISIHPRLAAMFEAVFSLVALGWLLKISNPWFVLVWFVVRMGAWYALTYFVYYPPYINRLKHLVSLFLCNIGITSLIIFSDPSNLLISEILAIILPVVSFWLIPSSANTLSIMEKPHRRWKFFMALIGVFGIWLTLLALVTFQIISSFDVLIAIFLSAVIISVISVWEWYEYGETSKNPKMTQLFFVLLLLLFEAACIIFLWPAGYFVGAFFLTWIWYLTWLLFRFNMSATGVDWKKQRFFLISNALLMLIFLSAVVRWN